MLEYFHPARGVGRTEAESERRACEGVLRQGQLRMAREANPKAYLALSSSRSGKAGRDHPTPAQVPPVRRTDQASLCVDLLNFPGSGIARVEPTWHTYNQKVVFTVQPEHSGFSSGLFTPQDVLVASSGPGDTTAAKMEGLACEIGGRLMDNWWEEQRLELAGFLKDTERFQPPPSNAQRPPTSRVLVPDSSAPAPGVLDEPISGERGPPSVSRRVLQENSDDTDPDSSPTKAVGKRVRARAGRERFDKGAKLRSSQHQDSSPEPEEHTEDEDDIEDADGEPNARRTARVPAASDGFAGTLVGRKRRRTNEVDLGAQSLPPFERPSASRLPLVPID